MRVYKLTADACEVLAGMLDEYETERRVRAEAIAVLRHMWGPMYDEMVNENEIESLMVVLHRCRDEDDD